MCQQGACPGRDQAAGQGRGYVSDHDYGVWRYLGYDWFEGDHDAGGLLGVGAGAGTEEPVGRPDAQVAEEDVVHGLVVVLAGVY